MRISSKSILSPGRAGVRDPPNSLSTSVSRRLRNSGSIKGGASPAMFPTTAKKRGSFENPEPSSPKVTCIGQVRVKSKKKQAKKLRTLSRRHSTGEVSFRKLDHPLNGFPSNNQNLKESLNLGSKGSHNQCYNQSQNQDHESCSRSWVHFPVTICDALRAFGSEFSCLFPCRKEEKMVAAEDNGRQGSCGAVFARWLVSVHDGNGGGERDIELVVGDEEEEDESFVRKTRRHVFEDLEIVNDRIEGHVDEARVSICIPPKNALLLMRCRSDPVRIEALTNKSWEPSFDKNDEEIVDLEDFKESHEDFEVGQQQVLNFNQDQENVRQVEANQSHKCENVQEIDVVQDQKVENVQGIELGQAQELENMQENEVIPQVQEHQNVLAENEAGQLQDHKEIEDEEEESLYLYSLFEEVLDQDYDTQEQDDSTMVTSLAKMFETPEEEMVNESKEGDNEALEKESETVLPQCLLMMMYEPKLSMEVSRETWVCSTDFKRHSSKRKPPPAPVIAPVKPDGGDESSVSGGGNVNDEMRVSDGGLPAVLLQPGRSSCSLPAAPSMAAVLGQKLADAVGYEPFVLTRCKSEPMKTAAAKLLPESCVWENRKVERLSRVTFGFGSTRLGF
ncbi:uncharacterized protein [Rutidosis leptorrhynchoides]|uniref:uncharacterized protein n=1 Tax=Rutidosis leptorrhynchoides TaxID=125765 RepID=UPI003A9A5006